MVNRPIFIEDDDYEIDLETSNPTFIKMATTLDRKGIKNSCFCLKIYDPYLIGVDPYDPDLDTETKTRILMEVTRNYWYFIREIARIPSAGSGIEIGGGDIFLLHRGNLAHSWAYENNINHYIEMPRQFGKTWGAIMRYLWVYNFGTQNSQIMFMNKQKQDAVDNLKRLKDARDLLPLYLQMNFDIDEETDKLKKTTDNVNEIKNGLKNRIVTKSSANNVAKADGLGRGNTQPLQWYDEFAFLMFNDIIYTAATPAFSKASESASRYGKPYCISITSTPGDLSTPHGKFAYMLKDRAATFTEEMYDYTPDQLFNYMEKNSSNTFIYIAFFYQQLGKGDAWFNKQCDILNGDWMKIRREILMQWNKSTSQSPFLPEDTDLLSKMQKTPLRNIMVNNYYKVDIYREYNPSDKVMIGCDVSAGLGRDACSAVVVDVETNRIIATFKNNRIGQKEFERFLLTLGTKFFPNNVLIIENNYLGSAVIESLRETCLNHNLYYETQSRMAEETRTNGYVTNSKSKRIVYGHTTSSTSRPKMMAILGEYVARYKDRIDVESIVHEICALEFKNNRVDHTDKEHDDVTMGYLATQYILRYGTNIYRFGIYNRDYDEEQLDLRDTMHEINQSNKKRKLKETNPFFYGLFEESESLEDAEHKSFLDRVRCIEDIQNGRSESGSLYQADNSHVSVMRDGVYAALNKLKSDRNNDDEDKGGFFNYLENGRW
jgi:hypothetical protein